MFPDFKIKLSRAEQSNSYHDFQFCYNNLTIARVSFCTQVVTDPARAAKRKINKQIKKKELKKRKVELMKGQKFKRKPKIKEEIDLEIF